MTPAEKRVKDLIDRWITSLDLHLEYVDLNDSAYNNVQPWPVHDRPTRWVLELAKQKALELKAAFDSRLAMGDAKFAESMELMVFLATLVGIQHVQRYIPLADPDRHGQATMTEIDGLKPVGKPAPPLQKSTPSGSMTVEATIAMPTRTTASPPVLTAPVATRPAPSRPPDEVTREMPRPTLNTNPPKSAPAAQVKPTPKPTPVITAPAEIQAASEAHMLVINDAVRLLNWGKPWHELAELVARIADRPKLPEVRRILRSHRAAIEMRVADAKEEKEGKENKEK